MAEVAEENHIITACSSLVVIASLGAATMLNKRKTIELNMGLTIH